MLLNIHVKNMALIDEADIDLTEGLNILTGETGAGKSIIIGSVNVALGLAGFKGFAREDAAFALAELVFSVDNERQRKALERLDIPMEDDQIIISRRLINGRSVSKVNGETVPVSLVRQVSEILIDIHGQHEHQALLHQKNHLAILDAFAGEELLEPINTVRNLYREYDSLEKKLKETDLSETARAKEMDFLAFEVGEIEEAALKTGEDEELEQAYRRQVNSQKIMEGVTEADNPQIMKKGRGVAIVLIFFVAAVVTPPDIVSQCMVAIPMVLLYFISTFLSGIFYKPRSEDGDEEEDEEDED